MPRRSWRLRVGDILDSIGFTREATSNRGYEAFASDQTLVFAVLRNIGIIGEASRYVPPAVQARHPDVPWREMRGLPALMYPSLGPGLDLVWNTIQRDLPPLALRLQAVLENEGGDSEIEREVDD